ncbi:PTS system mannose/fructose/sorbose family transporter subunit IID [Propionispora hippei]|uniref:PTS system, mannose-specific IID component n=1 Tax=Propionispora hippei DSM 15287 TaxID=1123003 RepID=A0A1M6I199_9FIRM|nr:PTS system mannose/fructose/sorbose family transporter subunit IID [Propionispora hippei]SHJ28252.1 PTS system, mannose-specific IID component [Propionispora hippei DSM 15287]
MAEQEKETEQKMLKKSDIVTSFWLWMFFYVSNYNYERLMSHSFTHALTPVLKRLYGHDKEQMAAALQRHLTFFNVEPHFGSIIGGITIALEEERAQGKPVSDQMINGLKTGLMGPIAGVGDTLWQGTLTPILLSFAISISSQGNLTGVGLYILLMPLIMFTIAYKLWMNGYRMGRAGLQKIMGGNMLQKVMAIAQTMGGIVLGGITASFVTLSSPVTFSRGNSIFNLQAEVFDKLLLGLLPLLITLFTLQLLNRKMKSTTVLCVIVAIAGLGAALGIF